MGTGGCKNCLWADTCQFIWPCQYYTPLDYEDRLLARDDERNRRQFAEDWAEANDYWEENFG